MKQRIKKIALIATSGGHFEQLSNLAGFYSSYPHFWVTNSTSQTQSELKNEKVYYLKTGHYKKPWTYLYHIPFFLIVFLKEKPRHIISTGSGRTALIAFFIAKLMKIEFVYIESFSRVKNISKFGEFLLKYGQKIYSQWKADINNNIEFIGPVLDPKLVRKTSMVESGYIFVTLGNRAEQFTRLLSSVEQLKKNGIIKNKIKVQAGCTNHKSGLLEIFSFCSQDEIDELIYNSEFVITQESAGIVTKCLKMRKRFLVMPRDYTFQELPSKSDMKEDLQYKLEELGYTKVVNNINELEFAIKKVDDLKVGYNFNNSFAIQTLKNIVGE